MIDVDRGGKITWHGPGQLVGYPIVALAEPVDVIAYVRALEEALIRACAEAGVATTRVEGRSGVWLTGGRGPAARRPQGGAIGIRVSRGVTMHGFALNCDCDLGWFDRIVPCGIRDAGVTSLSAETGRTVTVAGHAGRGGAPSGRTCSAPPAGTALTAPTRWPSRSRPTPSRRRSAPPADRACSRPQPPAASRAR